MRQRAKQALAIAAAILPIFAAGIYRTTPEVYLVHVRYLASPELKGRLTGTPELDKAADYIRAQFSKARLRPLTAHYLQDFEVTATTALSDADKLTLELKGQSKELKQGSDFVPLNLSGNGRAAGDVVFAGYGITAPEYHYDDYANIDVAGKIVLILRHEPQENDDQSVFAGKNLTEHALFSSKVADAKLHGARAVLLVNDVPNHEGDEDRLPKFEPLMATEDYGMLVVQISAGVAELLLENSNQTLKTLVLAIDQQLKPRSLVLTPGTKAAVIVALRQEKRTVHNVAGYWPGQTAEYIIIGAHYDHLGKGEQNSLAPSQIGKIHPGADDNASGTAGVIELARSIAVGGVHRRGFLFLCFAGEEEGLLGSSHYAGHPLRPLADAIAMINLDMIGRLQNNRLYIGGVATGSTFRAVVDQATKRERFQADESEAGGYGASDHTSFTAKRIPTLFFFSGLHSDYHKPSDTWEKINAKDAIRVVEEVSGIAVALADAPERPQFVSVAANPHSSDPGTSGGGGYGPYFGSVPDFGASTHGVRFSDVRDGSPAAKAGLRAGDVLIEFGGKPIQNLYDFTYALRQHKPGDTVSVKVLRNGAPVLADVLLTKRN